MKGELRKTQIIECGIKLFSKRGYLNTHVDDISRELSIGKGTFYQYFKNKEDLFIAILVKFLDDWEEQVLNPSRELVEGDLKTYYKTLMRQSLVFFHNNEDLCNIYLRICPGTDEMFEPYIDQFEEKMLQYVVNDLQRGVEAGIVRGDHDIVLMSNIIIGAFLRIDYYYFVLRRADKGSRDLDRMSDQFFDLIMDGILI